MPLTSLEIIMIKKFSPEDFLLKWVDNTDKISKIGLVLGMLQEHSKDLINHIKKSKTIIKTKNMKKKNKILNKKLKIKNPKKVHHKFINK
jgi:hypothetical protein